jgi:hypothetical protein
VECREAQADANVRPKVPLAPVINSGGVASGVGCQARACSLIGAAVGTIGWLRRFPAPTSRVLKAQDDVRANRSSNR